ncbi:MAG: hypothetical protein CL666_08800 [Balneola sp.]|nr:hypothetical protein [Balneola sp.]|tara:strand:+ start:962 stop:1210 length:249 start_codon:yes stop_codon:yes gene_type:complete
MNDSKKPAKDATASDVEAIVIGTGDMRDDLINMAWEFVKLGGFYSHGKLTEENVKDKMAVMITEFLNYYDAKWYVKLARRFI